MRNPLAYGQRIMVINWNRILAERCEQILCTMAHECGAHPDTFSVITRNHDQPELGRWVVSADKVLDYYYFLRPTIIVNDPFGVGNIPNPNSTYRDGVNLAKKFDQTDNCLQILWTNLELELLPRLENSYYISQEQSLNDVFEVMSHLAQL